MNKILYLEGSSGISGDMTVSALLDLGASRQYLEEQLGKLPIHDYRLVIGRTEKCGIDACAFYVELDESKPQPLRDYRQIRDMIAQSGMDEKAKVLSLQIFQALAKAEAKVHGTTMENVHFHEVGAVDSIVDIVSAAVCLVDLGIEQTVVGTLMEGTGTTWCQHGRIPVPVPATAELIAEYGLDMKITDVAGEMITPTGAAIAAVIRNRQMPERFRIEKIGIGSGEKDFKHANILRAMILVEDHENLVQVLETNVDDCTGEQLGYIQEVLLEAGALDAVYRPIYMKKSRPAYQLQVICKEEDADQLENIIFKETTTIGIRGYQAKRAVLERRIQEVHTDEGIVRVKVCRMGEREYCYPEYEDLKRYCKAAGTPFRESYEKIQKMAGDEK
ncbi:MAG: nickel pincer cofactor biosynthesis protein LarC [Clostridia bacterium]|nr:nickel pincer cofactor biosynthesis protein LarC [Clostridia bacterium]